MLPELHPQGAGSVPGLLLVSRVVVSGSLMASRLVTTARTMVFMKLPGFREIMAFAGNSGQGNGHQKQGE